MRIERLVREAVDRMGLNLSGICVLTEAATGPFAATALAACLGGAAQVVAVARTTRWGSAEDAIGAVRDLAQRVGCIDRIRFVVDDAVDAASGCHLVTNVGHVRPIGRELVSRLAKPAAVALMWEPWEFRPADIDLDALREFDVPIIGTAETHPHVRTFDYLGPTVGRLLLNAGIEIMRSRLLVVGSDPFGSSVQDWLCRAGADAVRASISSWRHAVMSAGQHPFDALLLLEHRDHTSLVTADDHGALAILAKWGAPIIRLCGVVDRSMIENAGATILPAHDVPTGMMSVTTAYAGPRPVVDLHTAGLKAASIVVRALRGGASPQAAVAAAVASGYGLSLA
ncbi:hypothetical protein [Elioraea sp.]|uniref:hypothetical protein n=1 Tax=Elioraea sp. TaxID=2185103 RepID=UPI0021DD4B4E|nr:hypothetical protein [Elioraea sp.]GIX11200.1 MAG: hypothetical protein KatS3mg116_2910 [Elioraea sp.]